MRRASNTRSFSHRETKRAFPEWAAKELSEERGRREPVPGIARNRTVSIATSGECRAADAQNQASAVEPLDD
jgi:hypothetical protein